MHTRSWYARSFLQKLDSAKPVYADCMIDIVFSGLQSVVLITIKMNNRELLTDKEAMLAAYNPHRVIVKSEFDNLQVCNEIYRPELLVVNCLCCLVSLTQS